jgi:FtsZ-interacting cell division protein ZipA
MNYSLDGTTLMVLALIALAVVVLVGVWVAQRRKSGVLRREFGPEYDRQIAKTRDRAKAEKELEARRRRVESYELQDLNESDRERFTRRWREVQKRFIDQPTRAVEEAALLLEEAMERRGYPLGEAQRQQADLSVHYPSEVQDYRRAHVIADLNRGGNANTEELREAIVCYRRLFAHLIGVDERVPTEVTT